MEKKNGRRPTMAAAAEADGGRAEIRIGEAAKEREDAVVGFFFFFCRESVGNVRMFTRENMQLRESFVWSEGRRREVEEPTRTAAALGEWRGKPFRLECTVCLLFMFLIVVCLFVVF
jgi:hypothetical protein